MPEWDGEVMCASQVEGWYTELKQQSQQSGSPKQRDYARKALGEIDHLIGCLRQFGPYLRRPQAGKIERDTPGIVTMFELRGQNPFVRIIFAFDQKRDAILLYGWDKQKDRQWQKGYDSAIAAADRLYVEHLASTPVIRVPTRKRKRT